jgi:hypothetical protein
MTIEKLFKLNLKQAIRQGFDNSAINKLCGCTERKIVLTQAEAEAGKQVYETFMRDKLWNDDEFGQGWLFGSPKTMLNIGLVPSKLAQNRLRLNAHCWADYPQVF